MKVPPLGSSQDKVLRKYLSIESDQKAAEAQMGMLQTMMTPQFSDPQKAGVWSDQVRKAWTNFLSKLYYVEVSEETQSDVQMLNYYEKFVKHLKPILKKSSKGKGLAVGGLDMLKKLISLENIRGKQKAESDREDEEKK